ncbi:hypothetical protein P67b_00088 [Ruegeria phage Tedan]|nr:hypothetical protein P67b_00088 [Ruegeria phage Tedan]
MIIAIGIFITNTGLVGSGQTPPPTGQGAFSSAFGAGFDV